MIKSLFNQPVKKTISESESSFHVLKYVKSMGEINMGNILTNFSETFTCVRSNNLFRRRRTLSLKEGAVLDERAELN